MKLVDGLEASEQRNYGRTLLFHPRTWVDVDVGGVGVGIASTVGRAGFELLFYELRK